MTAKQSSVRLTDVAAACGVSVATVSRALKGHSGIPEVTKEKVRAEARRLGYRPDARMEELMAQVRRGRGGAGTHNLALLFLSGTVAGEKRKNHIGAYARGVRERTEALGYGLVEASVKEHKNPGRLFRDTAVAGVVLCSPSDARIALELDWDRFAWAAAGFIPEEPALACAVPDFAHDARDCVAELARRGCKRPGFVHDPQVDSWLGRAWLGGFLAECSALGLKPNVERLSKAELPELASRWKRSPPDSLVLHDGYVEELWRGFGKAVPIRYLNLFSTREGKTGILPADVESGANAVDLVAGQLRRGERGIPAFQKRISVRGRWTEA